MKVAILHEMLIKFGWAEKVVEMFLEIFENADIFTLIYDEKKMWKFFPKNKINKQVFSLPSQKIYNLTKKQRFCLPFMAQSVEQLNFSKYDLVLCSSSWFAHWAITKPETKFVVYYHSPARYLWDWTNEYKKDIWFDRWIKWLILNKLFLKLRKWDVIASSRSDISIANSKNTQNRITKYFRKKSEIIYPWVEIERFSKILDLDNVCEKLKNIKNNLKKYYIIISTLTHYKKIDIAIKSFNKIVEANLIIIGQWNYEKNLKNIVKNKNIIFVWAQYWDNLVYLVQNSMWLIFPWEEDFWIVPIEVMASGKPVFAYKWWWLTETVKKWVTWEFFEDKEWKDFVKKFRIFHKNNLKNKYKEKHCKEQTKEFSCEIFKRKIKKFCFFWKTI